MCQQHKVLGSKVCESFQFTKTLDSLQSTEFVLSRAFTYMLFLDIVFHVSNKIRLQVAIPAFLYAISVLYSLIVYVKIADGHAVHE